MKNKPSDVQYKKKELYTLTSDGHYVGCDGYVVPKTFLEFYEREPLGVRLFLMKKLHRQIVDEVVLDMEQELLLHLHYLPESSKHRKAGRTDIVQCFDPVMHHGASAKRFHNFLAVCMQRRFFTLLHKQKKNPVYNKTNLSIVEESSSQGDHYPQPGEISGEYLHSHSTAVAERAAKNDGASNIQKIFINEFRSYVEKSAPDMISVLEAIVDTNSLKEAREALGCNNRAFDKHRETLDLLQDCFLRGEEFTTFRQVAKNRRAARIVATREKKKIAKEPVTAQHG